MNKLLFVFHETSFIKKYPKIPENTHSSSVKNYLPWKSISSTENTTTISEWLGCLGGNSICSPNGLPRSADKARGPARMGGHLGSISNSPLNGLTSAVCPSTHITLPKIEVLNSQRTISVICATLICRWHQILVNSQQVCFLFFHGRRHFFMEDGCLFFHGRWNFCFMEDENSNLYV